MLLIRGAYFRGGAYIRDFTACFMSCVWPITMRCRTFSASPFFFDTWMIKDYLNFDPNLLPRILRLFLVEKDL